MVTTEGYKMFIYALNCETLFPGEVREIETGYRAHLHPYVEMTVSETNGFPELRIYQYSCIGRPYPDGRRTGYPIKLLVQNTSDYILELRAHQIKAEMVFLRFRRNTPMVRETSTYRDCEVTFDRFQVEGDFEEDSDESDESIENSGGINILNFQ